MQNLDILEKNFKAIDSPSSLESFINIHSFEKKLYRGETYGIYFEATHVELCRFVKKSNTDIQGKQRNYLTLTLYSNEGKKISSLIHILLV